jgi:hypothetical protein
MYATSRRMEFDILKGSQIPIAKWLSNFKLLTSEGLRDSAAVLKLFGQRSKSQQAAFQPRQSRAARINLNLMSAVERIPVIASCMDATIFVGPKSR